MKALGQIRKNDKLTGFSIMEVLIATMVLALAIGGILASVNYLRAPAAESSSEVTAAFIGKRVLDDLRADVSAETWDTGNLNIGRHTSTVTVNGVDYRVNYLVENDPNGTTARRVSMNIDW